MVDGEEFDFTSMKGNDCYTVLLPPGRHRVDVTAGDVFTYGISVASFWSSTGIAVFGITAVTLLIAMYSLWAVVRVRTASRER